MKLIGHLEQLVNIYDQQETMWNKNLFSKILQFIVPVRLSFECYDGLYSHPFAFSLSSSVYWATYHSYGDHFLSLSLSLSPHHLHSPVLSLSLQHSWASSSIPSCPSVICDTILSVHLLVCLTSPFPFLFLSPKVFSIVLCLFNVNADGRGQAVP